MLGSDTMQNCSKFLLVMSNLVYLPEGKVIYKVNIRHYNKPMWIVHKLIIKSSKNVLVAILKR